MEDKKIFRAMQLTVKENDKIRELKQLFKNIEGKKYITADIVKLAFDNISRIEKLDVAQEYEDNKKQKFIKVMVYLPEKLYNDIVEYSNSHFREIINTVRYMINGYYKIVFKK